MSALLIFGFFVAAVLFILMRVSPAVKEKVSSVWAAVVALAMAAATWLASWWADVPVDIPPA